MKKIGLLLTLTLAAGTPLLLAAHDCSLADKPAASATPDATWLAQAKAEYPLKTCVVSGEEFGGGMGEAVDYVYKQEGRPDRLVRFCCEMCLPKFKKDPAKFLKKIDDAAAQAKKS
jgi:hypothetical protein